VSPREGSHSAATGAKKRDVEWLLTGPALVSLVTCFLGAVPSAQFGPASKQPARITLQARIEEAAVRAGQTFHLALDVAPKPGIHIYAPGNVTYPAVNLFLQPRPGLRVGALSMPPGVDYFFAPLQERVKVYVAPFTIRQPLTLTTASAARTPIEGTLHYQACDDRVCFPPASVSFRASLPSAKPAGAS
jgi:DsbC/DsbD-like thiol-disulfide interchange protein